MQRKAPFEITSFKEGRWTYFRGWVFFLGDDGTLEHFGTWLLLAASQLLDPMQIAQIQSAELTTLPTTLAIDTNACSYIGFT